MRFFRIPGFTGIEAHRDDADRGSLRVVEGCLPHGTGGLRSGPVWKKVGRVDYFSSDNKNVVSAGDDNNGNSLIFSSRQCYVRDMAVFTSVNTEFKEIGKTYDVATPVDGLFERADATISAIGNRLIAVGDGSNEAIYLGKGPSVSGGDVYPDEMLYNQEWSRFPKCQYYVRGPKSTIFAAGNPERPLTVYISEPAGMTSSFRDSPYSTEDSGIYNPGRLSTVDIISSDASYITALSTRGDQVIVHTDKGCYLLYAPSADQASTGYRVEQSPATNFSAAVSHKVVSGDGGDQTFWVGHDGQVYKDEAASRGSADLKSYADQDQANWKSKGVWEHELPYDLSLSFSAFCAQTGDYLFFVESEEAKSFNYIDSAAEMPVNISSELNVPVSYTCRDKHCDDKNCCGAVNRDPDPANGFYPTLTECIKNSDCTGFCCTDALSLTSEETNLTTLAQYEELFSMCHGTCPDSDPGLWRIDDCGQCESFLFTNPNEHPDLGHSSFLTLPECLLAAQLIPSDEIADGCYWDYENCGECVDTHLKSSRFSSLEECEQERALDDCRYTLDETHKNTGSCECVQDDGGEYGTLGQCLVAKTLNCSYYTYDQELCSDCELAENQDGSQGAIGLETCRQVRESDPGCKIFYAASICTIEGNYCLDYSDGATYMHITDDNPAHTHFLDFYDSLEECNNDSRLATYSCDYGYELDLTNCACSYEPGGTYETQEDCLRNLDNNEEMCPKTMLDYAFAYIDDPEDTTVVRTMFAEAESTVRDFFGQQALASYYNYKSTNHEIHYNRSDTPTPDTMYFGIYVEAEEGYTYELSVPVPGSDGPASSLYSSSYPGSFTEGELKLNQLNVFSVTPTATIDYTTGHYQSSPTTPSFILTRKPEKYSFLGCEFGFDNACFHDDDHGDLTYEECTQQYASECMP